LSESSPLIINGWRIFGHSLFISQIEELLSQVEFLRRKHPTDYKKKNATRRLAAIERLVFKIIPQNPAHADYRQGTTLGNSRKHWFRAIFFQQYRLFFRYHLESKILIFVWVNDTKTKRSYESKTDAYRVFKKMLNKGYPPDDWDTLLKQSEAETSRFKNIIPDL